MSLGVESITALGADNYSSSDLQVTVTLVLAHLQSDDDVLECHSLISRGKKLDLWT